jgi:glycosyltransferase involved in cell wall biosynthesis
VRILIANDGFGDAGGVQSYLDRVATGLVGRGHEVAILHRDAVLASFAADATYALTRFSVASHGVGPALDAVASWRPDLCFSHNMDRLEVDGALAERWPVVKFMHGYLGTCIGGQKRHGFPSPVPCDRVFGAPCLALYGPRHCGELTLSKFVGQYRWAKAQQSLFAGYRAIVVASGHMKREFVRHGVPDGRVLVNPLFPTHDEHVGSVCSAGEGDSVAFLGRMTVLKGGDLLLRAIAAASGQLGRPINALMIGDGPQRPRWEQIARELQVAATFTGWVKGSDRWALVRRAALVAVPSTWPEPFGLVGLEAAALGVPAIAFDVGGISEWLRDGVSGRLLQGPPRVETLAAALVELLNAKDRLGAMRAGALAAAREMTLDAHLDRLERVFAGSRSPARAPAEG